MTDIRDFEALRANYALQNVEGADYRAVLVQGDYNIAPTEPRSPNQGFWQVMANDLEQDAVSGWKIHISIAEADVPRAWELASHYLMAQGAGAFKVAAPDGLARFSDPDALQAGKIITVNHVENGPDLRTLAQGLENLFREHGIQPGPVVRNDRLVPGSNYQYYRNDFDQDGHYLSSRQVSRSDIPVAERYNVAGAADPLAGFAVTPPAARPIGMLETMVAAQREAGRVHRVGTHSGEAIVFQGTADELARMQTGFADLGVRAHPVTSSQYGNVLMIHPQDTEHAYDMVNRARHMPRGASTVLETTVDAAHFQNTVSRLKESHQITYLDTNKGTTLALFGSPNELDVLQRGFAARGVELVRESRTTGDFLRARSADSYTARAVISEVMAERNAGERAFVSLLSSKALDGELQMVPTSKGESITFTGTPEEFATLQQGFAARGVQTTLEVNAEYGNVLRVRSDSTALAAETVARAAASHLHAPSGAAGLSRLKSARVLGAFAGPALTAAGLLATVSANASVVDEAARLHASGMLSPDALRDFEQIMDNDIGPVLVASAADPTVAAFVHMPATEAYATMTYQDFSNKHMLPEHVHQALSPALVTNQSLRGAFGEAVMEQVMEGAELPESLAALSVMRAARQEANESVGRSWSHQRIRGRHGLEAVNTPEVHRYLEIRDGWQGQFDRLLSSASLEATQALVSMIPEDVLVDMLPAIAAADYANKPEILTQFGNAINRVEALEAQLDARSGAGELRGAAARSIRRDLRRAENELEEITDIVMENPDAMREHIAGYFYQARVANEVVRDAARGLGGVQVVEQVTEEPRGAAELNAAAVLARDGVQI